MLLNHTHIKDGSVAQGRNTATIRWFILGSLREAAQAIGDLLAALAKRGWLDTSDADFRSLRDFELRWKGYGDLRDQAAFHVDLPVVASGVEHLARRETVVLAAGDGPNDQDASLVIGNEALLRGLDIDVDALLAIFRAVDEDHQIGLTLQKLFASVTDRAELEVGGEGDHA